MIFDGVIVKQGSNVQNLVLSSGAAFPSTANDGELFYINSTGSGNSIGLFIYEAGTTSWIRQLTTLDNIASLLPSIVTPGTYNTITVNSSGLVTSASNTALVTSLIGSTNVLVSSATGAVTISLPSTISSNTTGTASNITGIYAGTITSLQVTNALGYTPLRTNPTISIAGDASGTGTTSITLTLDTVNTSIGTFGSATSVPVITVNGKGLVTSVTTATITGGGTGTLTAVTGTANQITVTTTGSTVALSLPSNIVVPPATSGTALSLSAAAAVPLAINITSGANTAISLTGPSATNLSVITFQQTGQNSLLLYNPASTNNINLYSSSHGDIVSFLGTGGISVPATSTGPALKLNTSNSAYSQDSTANATMILANSASQAQTSIDFTLTGNLVGRLRSDYAGNMNYVGTSSGTHNFFVNGDSGVGTETASIAAAGMNVNSLGVGVAPNGAGNIYTSGGLGIAGGATFGSIISRSSTLSYLSGNYSSVENGQTAGAIYSIGGNYAPAGGANPLGNMYGIGFTTSSTVNGTSGSTTIAAANGSSLNQWGLYVASSGNASIFLNSDTGGIYSKYLALNGTTAAQLNSNVNNYGSIAVSGAYQGWAGTQYTSSYQLQTFMVSTTAAWSGVYSVSSGIWDWYINAGVMTGVTQLNGNASTATLASSVSLSSLTANLNYDMMAAASTTAPGYIGNITGNPSTGTLTATNIVGTTNVTTNSDARLKENIQQIPDALSKVKALLGVNFTLKKDGKKGTGLIAQNVREVIPEAVLEGEYLSIAYGNLVGVLIEAIKELDEKVEDMKRDQR